LEIGDIIQNYSSITTINFVGNNEYSQYSGIYNIYTGYMIENQSLLQNDNQHYYFNENTNSGFFREHQNGLWKFVTNLIEPFTSIEVNNNSSIFGIFKNKDDIKVSLNNNIFGSLTDIS